MCCHQAALPYFLKFTSNSGKYRKNLKNKFLKRAALLVKPLACIVYPTLLNSELSQSYVSQELYLAFKSTKFSKQILMVAFAINHLWILWSMMTENKAAFSEFS